MSTARRPGRPVSGTEPAFDEAELEKLLVHGEFADDDVRDHRYPSYRELAERFSISHAAVHRFSRRHNCLERRADSGATDETTVPVAAGVAPAATGMATGAPAERAYARGRRIVLRWLDSVDRGTTRLANPIEATRVLELCAKLDTEAYQRELLPKGYPTLEEIEAFCARRDQEYVAASPGARGEIPIGLDEPQATTTSVADEPRSREDAEGDGVEGGEQ